MDEIILEDGKYRFYMENHTLKCDRYGEKWREFIGDKAVSALFGYAIDLIEEENQKGMDRDLVED